MRKWRFHYTYRQKLVLVFMLVTIIPLSLLYTYLGYWLYTTHKADVTERASETLKKDAAILDGIYSNYIQSLDMIRRDYRIQNLLHAKQPMKMSIGVFDSYYELNRLYNTIKDTSSSWRMTVYSLNPYILEGAFFKDAGKMNPTLLEKVLDEKYRDYIWAYESDTRTGWEALYILTSYVSTTDEAYAIGQIDVGFDRVRACFAGNYPQGAKIIYYIDGITPVDLTAPYGAGDESARRFLTGSMSGYYIVTTPILTNQDYVTVYLPEAYVRNEMIYPMVLLIAGYILIILLFLLLTTLISRSLSQRLYKLIEDVNQDIPHLLEKDHFSLFEGTDEFAKINRRFKDLVMEIKHRYEEQARVETKNQSLELELLQSLINPHFLYNTLDGIKWTYRNDRLSMIIDDMVRYYRIALNRGNAILLISQELEMARLYLGIQKFAYESEFQYTIDMAEELTNSLMLKNIVQPVVENAFLHGIKRNPQDMIAVTGYRDGDDAIIKVTDNGVGMGPDKAQQIINGTYEGVMGGYGLYNIIQRLQLFYGEGYGLSIISEKGKGTIVTIRLKYLPADTPS